MDSPTADAPAVVRMLSAMNRVLLLVCRWLAITLVGSMAVIVIASVIWRYVLNDSLSWSEDVAKFLMVWLTFIGAPLGFRHGAHVSISLVPRAAPAVIRRIVRILVHAIVLALMLILVWYSWIFAWNGRSQVALTIGDISMLWVFIAMPIGAVLMAMVALELMVTALAGRPEPELTEDEQITTQGM
jgi:TRAP-type transport system small permease protein